MISVQRRDTFNFYESFSDLIFCTLVLFVVLVLFLAVNIKGQMKDIITEEKSLTLKEIEAKKTAEELKGFEQKVLSLENDYKVSLEDVENIEDIQRSMSSLENDIEKNTVLSAQYEKIIPESAKSRESLEAQQAQVESKRKEYESRKELLNNRKAELSIQKNNFNKLKEIAEAAQFEDTETGGIYTLSGSKGTGIMVPCYRQYNALLVIKGKIGTLKGNVLTYEGKHTTWGELPLLLEKVPHRYHTIICVSLETNNIYYILYPRKQKLPVQNKLTELWQKFGFQGFSYIEEHPLGTKASETRLGSSRLVPWE